MSIPPPSGPHQPQEPYAQGDFRLPPPGFPYSGPPQAAGACPPPPYQLWGQGYSPYNRPAPVNGVAIASLVLGVLCFLPGVGLVLGLIALRQIRKRGERGRGMAVAGSVLSSVGLALWVLTLSTGAVTGVWEGFKDGATASASMDEGTCFDSPKGLEGAAYAFDEVPCADEHDAEVFAVVTLPGGSYPGDRALEDTADDTCYARRTDYAMDAWAVPDDVDVYYLLPSRASWRLGDREITCAFGNTDENATLTGSLRNDSTILDADQTAYLKAVNTLEAALDSAPDSTPDDDLPANREWAARVADALHTEAALLRRHRWPATAERPVTGVAREVQALQKEWALAAVAANVNGFYQHYDRTVTIEHPATSVTARKALGLATTPPSHDDDPGDSGGGGDKGGAEVWAAP
ncbi:DUF4190 domain-containing protein [Streptomyces sp. NPDC005574]|uniref:DUF4190 domain-containing protein n=1 Tax=Streptomyces sp. NPDC005574 TaxID=3156891 RepID=UPI00339F85B8